MNVPEAERLARRLVSDIVLCDLDGGRALFGNDLDVLEWRDKKRVERALRILAGRLAMPGRIPKKRHAKKAG